MDIPPSRQIAILGVPFDAFSSFKRGPASAPPLIREALFCDSSNMFAENGVDVGREGLLFDAGDLELKDESAAFAKIENRVGELLSFGRNLISLGGDHSITFPIIRAFREHHQALSILHFDAHPDLHHEFEGNLFSHASPFARIMESGLADRLVQIGIRTINRHQREQVARFGVELIEMNDWSDSLSLRFETPVYISFDLDGLDPAYAPGVSHREPGGLSTRQAINLIRRIKGQVVGADIVEFNPLNDPSGVTAILCAKLLKEIAGRIMLDSGVAA